MADLSNLAPVIAGVVAAAAGLSTLYAFHRNKPRFDRAPREEGSPPSEQMPLEVLWDTHRAASGLRVKVVGLAGSALRSDASYAPQARSPRESA